MASTGLNFDGVSFSIQCESKEAQVNINGLSTSLDNIKSVVKGGINGLSLVANNLKLLNESSQGVPTTIKNLDNIGTLANNLNALGNVTAMNKTVVNRLKEMNEVSATIETTSKNISSVTNMVEPLQQLSTIATPTGLTAIVKDLTTLKNVSGGDITNITSNVKTLVESIPDLQRFAEIQTPKGFKAVAQDIGILAENIKKIDATTLENVRTVSVQLAYAIKPLADEMGKVANGYSAISQMSRTYGVSLTRLNSHQKKNIDLSNKLKTVTSSVYGIFKRTYGFGEKQVEKLQKSFKKLRSTTKQVALSLLGTRTLFTMIRKAASEYQAFDTSMQKFNQNVWRAFGAQLAPAMEYMMNLFKQFVRVIYSIIKALTGMDLIARANARAMSNYAGATAKAVKELGNLQKFDDLNTVDFPDNSGSGDGGFEPIQLDEIDLTPIQKVIDWTKKLKQAFKDAFATGGWEKVGVVFAEGINDGMTFLLNNVDTVRNKIFKIIDDITDTINGFIKTIDTGKIAKLVSEKYKLLFDTITRFISNIAFADLGKKITDFFANLDLKGMIDSFGNAWVEIFKGLGEMLENIDFTVIAGKISEAIKTAFSKLGEIIDSIPWEEIGTAVRETILNIDWIGIFQTILNVLGEVIKGAGELLAGLFNINEDDINKIKDVLKVLEPLKEKIDEVWSTVKEFYYETLKPLFQFLYDILKPFIESAIDILTILWKNVIKPLAHFIIEVFKVAFDLLSLAIKGLMNYLNPLIDILSWMWKHVLSPIVSFILSNVIMAIERVTTKIKDKIQIISAAFRGLSNLLQSILDSTKNGFTGFANFILEKLESLINKIINGVNWLTKKINKIKIDIPDWVPGIGGSKFGFSINQIDNISLPRLETGTNEIPYEGIYHLHPGEAVVPKKYNPALGGGTNTETNRRLDTLINIVENMDFTNIVNIGNKKLYEEQTSFNKRQINKYGTLSSIY